MIMGKVLIVIDMQNDFITGSLGTPEAQAIVPKVKARIDEYVANRNKVIFTRDTHFGGYLQTNEGRHLPIPHCILRSRGWQIPEDIDIPEFDHIDKFTFGYCDWINYGIYFDDDIEIVGVCTDICVISNALILKTKFPAAKITVDASCCAGTSVENHKKAIDVMKNCQIDIVGED